MTGKRVSIGMGKRVSIGAGKRASMGMGKRASIGASISTTSFRFENASKGTFAENYAVGKELGRGTYAVVKDATNKNTGKPYAVKILHISGLGKKGEAGLMEEISILSQLRHDNIILLHEVFKEHGFYFMVTEKMQGGELFDRIVRKTCYSEKEARDTCKAILSAIQFCHKHHIAHRDLKPENLLLQNTKSDTDIKLADFGFAKKCKKPRSLTTMCGTPGYIAPEIYKKKPYDTSVDMWALGVIMYILLGGYAPFDENNDGYRREQICQGLYEFHDEYWRHISNGAKDLIQGCMTVRRKNRLTADQALKNRWITGDARQLSRNDLSVNSGKFKQYHAKNKTKTAATARKSSLLVGDSSSIQPDAVNRKGSQITVESLDINDLFGRRVSTGAGTVDMSDTYSRRISTGAGTADIHEVYGRRISTGAGTTVSALGDEPSEYSENNGYHPGMITTVQMPLPNDIDISINTHGSQLGMDNPLSPGHVRQIVTTNEGFTSIGLADQPSEASFHGHGFVRRCSKLGVKFDNYSKGTFADNYLIGKKLGHGKYATVKDACYITTGEKFAVKIVALADIGKSGEERLIEEVKVLKRLRHPNIICLYEVFKEHGYYYMVLEKMQGGELLDRIVKKTCYTEGEARQTCISLLKAIQFCHKNHVAHRDLKPENLLLLREDSDTEIKIADFGFAKKCKRARSLTTFCGTEGYIAPEIYKKKPFDVQADMWSLGVIIYILLGGYAPFDEENGVARKEQTCKGLYAFHDVYWSHISQSAKDLITGMLTVKRANRWSADKALKSKWITQAGETKVAKSGGAGNLTNEINLKALKRFCDKHKVKAAVKTAMFTPSSRGLDPESIANKAMEASFANIGGSKKDALENSIMEEEDELEGSTGPFVESPKISQSAVPSTNLLPAMSASANNFDEGPSLPLRVESAREDAAPDDTYSATNGMANGPAAAQNGQKEINELKQQLVDAHSKVYALKSELANERSQRLAAEQMVQKLMQTVEEFRNQGHATSPTGTVEIPVRAERNVADDEDDHTSYNSARQNGTTVASADVDDDDDLDGRFEAEVLQRWHGKTDVKPAERLEAELQFLTSVYSDDELAFDESQVARYLKLSLKDAHRDLDANSQDSAADVVQVQLTLDIPKGYPIKGSLYVKARMQDDEDHGEMTDFIKRTRRTVEVMLPSLIHTCQVEAENYTGSESIYFVLATADRWMQQEWVTAAAAVNIGQ